MDTQGQFSGSEGSRPDGATDVLFTQGSGGVDAGGAESLGDKAGEVVEQAKEKAGDVVFQAKETAGEVVDKVRQQASSQLDTQKERAIGTLERFQLAVMQSSVQLREQDQVGASQVADKAAEQIDRLSTYLRNRDPREIVTEVERFARRQPMIFLGTAFTLGLIGARFLKSSGHQGQGTGGYSRAYGYGSSGTGYSTDYSTTRDSTPDYSADYGATTPSVDLHAAHDHPIDYSESGSLTEETELTEEAGATEESGAKKKKGRKERTWTGSSLEES